MRDKFEVDEQEKLQKPTERRNNKLKSGVFSRIPIKI